MKANPHSAIRSLIQANGINLRPVGALSIPSLILINLVNLLVLGLIIIA